MAVLNKRRRARRVVLVGLDGAGKTTIMQQLTTQQAPTNRTQNTLPTIGFTVREVVLRGVAITLFDVGGQTMLRELWPQYCHAADALIIVVDANDELRLREFREELHKLLDARESGLENVAVLVLANKQDQPNAIRPAQLAEYLQLDQRHLSWHVQGTVGINGTGLSAGIDWLTEKLSPKPLLKRRVKVRHCFGCGKPPAKDRGVGIASPHRSPDEARKLDTMHTLADDVTRLREAVSRLNAENSELRASSQRLRDHNRRLCAQLVTHGVTPEALPPEPLSSPLSGVSSTPAQNRFIVRTAPESLERSSPVEVAAPSATEPPVAESDVDVQIVHHEPPATPVTPPPSTANLLATAERDDSTAHDESGAGLGVGARGPGGVASSEEEGVLSLKEQLARAREEAAENARKVEALLETNAELSKLASAGATIAEQYSKRTREEQAKLDRERRAALELRQQYEQLVETEQQVSSRLEHAERRASELSDALVELRRSQAVRGDDHDSSAATSDFEQETPHANGVEPHTNGVEQHANGVEPHDDESSDGPISEERLAASLKRTTDRRTSIGSEASELRT